MKEFILDRFQRETKKCKDSYISELALFVLIVIMPICLVYSVAMTQITSSIPRRVIGVSLCIVAGILVGICSVALIRSIRTYYKDLRLREEIECLENYLSDEKGIINRYYLSQCIAMAQEYYPKSLVDYPGIPVATFMSYIDKESRYDIIWHELADRGLKSDVVTVYNSFRDFALVFKVINHKTVKIAFFMIPAGEYFTREVVVDNLFDLDTAIASIVPPNTDETIYRTTLSLEEFQQVFS